MCRLEDLLDECPAALLDAGVDGLVTDRPDVLRDVLIQRGCWPGTGQ